MKSSSERPRKKRAWYSMRWPYALVLVFLSATLSVGWVIQRNLVGFLERSIGHDLQRIYDRAWDATGERPRTLDAEAVARAIRGKEAFSMNPGPRGLWVRRKAVTVGAMSCFW